MGSLFTSEQARHRILYWLVKGTEYPARYGREAHVAVDIRGMAEGSLPSEAALEEEARAFWAEQDSD